MMKKRIVASCLAAVLAACVLCSCTQKEYDFEDTYIVIKGDQPAVPYLQALANRRYYLDVSLFTGGMIIYNTVAQNGDTIESRSNYGGSVSHTLSKNGVTYFLDDEHKVYFKADIAEGEGLKAVVDYSKCEYVGSGEETLMTGSTHHYDEYSCETFDGIECGVKIFTNSEGELVAIVDYDASSSIERDVAAFSAEIPEGWLEIPKDYTEVDEDTYFEEYYGK